MSHSFVILSRNFLYDKSENKVSQSIFLGLKDSFVL